MKWNWETFESNLVNWLIKHVPAIIMGIIIFIIGLWLSRLFSKWIKKIFGRRKVDPSLSYFLQNLLVITLQILVLFLSLQVTGIQLTFLTAIVAGLTVAAGLALSGTLQNFVSGLLILLLRPYKVNDTVIIQGEQGTVTSIQLFYTMVLTFDNKTIIVPNGQLSNNPITNLSREGKRRIDLLLKFPYKADINELRKMIIELLITVEGVINNPPPRIGVAGLETDKYAVSIQVWTKAHGYEDTKFLIQEKILEILKKNEMLLA
jgi:small conductance mechanosensitive channel